METLIWILLTLILIIYVIVIPLLNQRKMKQDQLKMKEFQERLEVNNEVVMANGIHGKVKRLQGNTALIEIAPKVVIQVERIAIVGVKNTASGGE